MSAETEDPDLDQGVVDESVDLSLGDEVGDSGDGPLSDIEKQVYSRQKRWCIGYARGGTIAAGCTAAGVDRRTYERWMARDRFGFRRAKTRALDEFGDLLEDLALELVKGLSVTNSPLLLITLLNANKPDKYRPGVVVVDDTAKDLLAELRKQGKESRSSKGKAGGGGEEEEERGASVRLLTEAERLLGIRE